MILSFAKIDNLFLGTLLQMLTSCDEMLPYRMNCFQEVYKMLFKGCYYPIGMMFIL